MPRSETMHIRMTSVERMALDQIAEQDSRTRSSLVRYLLKQLIDEADAEGTISLSEIRKELEGEDLSEARRAWRGA